MSTRAEILADYDKTEADVEVDEQGEFITYLKTDEHEIDGRVIEGDEHLIKVYLNPTHHE